MVFQVDPSWLGNAIDYDEAIKRNPKSTDRTEALRPYANSTNEKMQQAYSYWMNRSTDEEQEQLLKKEYAPEIQTIRSHLWKVMQRDNAVRSSVIPSSHEATTTARSSAIPSPDEATNTARSSPIPNSDEATNNGYWSKKKWCILAGVIAIIATAIIIEFSVDKSINILGSSTGVGVGIGIGTGMESHG